MALFDFLQPKKNQPNPILELLAKIQSAVPQQVQKPIQQSPLGQLLGPKPQVAPTPPQINPAVLAGLKPDLQNLQSQAPISAAQTKVTPPPPAVIQHFADAAQQTLQEDIVDPFMRAARARYRGDLPATVGQSLMTAIGIVSSPLMLASRATERQLENIPGMKRGQKLGFIPPIAGFAVSMSDPEGLIKGATKAPEVLKVAQKISTKPEDIINIIKDITQSTNADTANTVAENLSKIGDKTTKGIGRVVRESFLNVRNRLQGVAQQTAMELERTLKGSTERQAATIFHEIKGNPEGLKTVQTLLESNDPRIKDIKKVLQIVVNPTEKQAARLQKADEILTKYYGDRLQAGLKSGVLKGGLQDYITHIIRQGEKATGFADIPRSQLTRSTPFARKRIYQTLIDDILAGKEPATIDAADIVRIYGDRDAAASATRAMVDTLKSSKLGFWLSSKDAPASFSDLSRFSRSLETPYKKFFVPSQIADALKPIADPDYLKGVGGIRNWRLAQAWVKGINLSLSLFHAWSLSLASAASMNPVDMVKAFSVAFSRHMDNPSFLENELDMLAHNGTSPIQGGAYDAFRNVVRTEKQSLASRIIFNNPLTKAFDAVANTTAGITFDRMMRAYKVTDYTSKVTKWMAEHPNATDAELNAYKNKVGTLVNDIYGGLNWEQMGVSKSMQSALRMVLLAPDWTLSNFAIPFQAKGGQVPTAQGIRFLAQGMIQGILATQAMNLQLNGKLGETPFYVDLGTRSDGTKVRDMMFFSGSQKDFIATIQKMQQYGPIGGLTQEVSSKAAPFVQPLAQLATNRDWQGNPIFSKDASQQANFAAALKFAGGNLPLPFPVTKTFQTVTGQPAGDQPKPLELVSSVTGIGQVSTDSAKQAVFQKAYNEAIASGSSPLAAQLAGVKALTDSGLYTPKPKVAGPKKIKAKKPRKPRARKPKKLSLKKIRASKGRKLELRSLKPKRKTLRVGKLSLTKVI